MKRAYYPALDGLRAVACILVLLYHLDIQPALGWAGVVLFFVLSGFLITDILVAEKERCSSLGGYWGRFAWRRACRIFPLYYLVLTIVVLVSPGAQWWPHALYIHNLNSDWKPVLGFAHTWSLCVEEQFYLLWPLVVWFTPTSKLPRVSIAIIIAALAWRAFHATDTGVTYFHTLSVMDELAIGALLACIRREYGSLVIPAAVREGFWAVTIALLALRFIAPDGLIQGLTQALDSRLTTGLLLGAVFSVAIAIAIEHPPAVLCWKPLRHLGVISYGLYLWHMPVFLVVDHLLPAYGGGVGQLAGSMAMKLGGTYLAALFSWNLYEQWFLKLKDVRFGRRSPAAAGEVAVQESAA